MEIIKYFITHNDEDAAGAEVVEKVFSREHDLIYVYKCNYQDVDDKVNEILDKFEFENLHAKTKIEIKIVDISVNEDTANRITEMLNIYEDSLRILLLDHHKTTDHLQNLDWCIIDKSKSGCKLLYDTCYYDMYHTTDNIDDIIKDNEYNPLGSKIELNINKIEEFVNLIDLYDTWKWKKETEEKQKEILDLKYYYNICGHEYFVRFYINELKSENVNLTLALHNQELIDNYRVKQQEKIKCKMNQFKLVDGIAYIISDDIEITSLLADAILNKYPEVKIVAVIYGNGVALRSRESENYDVSTLAKKYGGGGHKNAAGFKINLINNLNFEIKI